MGIFNWKKKGKSLLTQTEENLDIYENIDTYLKKHNIVEPDASVSDNYRYEDREMQGGEGLDNEFSGGSKLDFEQYTWEQCQDFVAVSCEQMQDASRRIEESKREMQIVNSYMSDVQLIQNMPTESRNDVEKLAKRIVRLEQDKEEYGKFKT